MGALRAPRRSPLGHMRRGGAAAGGPGVEGARPGAAPELARPHRMRAGRRRRCGAQRLRVDPDSSDARRCRKAVHGPTAAPLGASRNRRAARNRAHHRPASGGDAGRGTAVAAFSPRRPGALERRDDWSAGPARERAQRTRAVQRAGVAPAQPAVLRAAGPAPALTARPGQTPGRPKSAQRASGCAARRANMPQPRMSSTSSSR